MIEEVIENIKSLIPVDDQVIVEKRKCPSFISIFLQSDEDIILIYGQGKPDASQYVCHDLDITSVAELTGQPLEAPFKPGDDSLSLSLTTCHETSKEKFTPVPTTKARLYLSKCNLLIKPELPVWVLCDGNDEQRTTLLSSYQKEGWIERAWAVDQGRENETLSLESLFALHSYLSTIPYHLTKCEVSCSCCIHEQQSTYSTGKLYSSTTLQLKWKKQCIEPPLDASTQAALNTKCWLGEGTGGLSAIWEQLLLLQGYFELAISQAKTNTPSTTLTLPSSQKALEQLSGKAHIKGDVSSRLAKVVGERLQNQLPVIKSGMNLEDIINLLAKPARLGLELTDKLWYLLIDCSTFQELSAAFRELFIEINRNGCPKFASPTCDSRLGRVIAGHGRANILEPLEFLIEIGIEKLKKEMLLIFSKAQIATLNSLHLPKLPKFWEISSSGWQGAVETWLSWLGGALCSLELLCNMRTALGLSGEALQGLAKGVLNQCLGPAAFHPSLPALIAEPVVEITLPVQANLVDKHIVQNIWLDWRLQLSSANDIRRATSIFYRGLLPPFPHADSDFQDLLAEETEAPSYYSAQLHIVGDKFFDKKSDC